MAEPFNVRNGIRLVVQVALACAAFRAVLSVLQGAVAAGRGASGDEKYHAKKGWVPF